MSELKYAIMRYSPSLVSGESINIAGLFFFPETKYREVYTVSNWQRVASFDESLDISALKDILSDMEEEVGTELTNPGFDIVKFCAQYCSELYFDTTITLTGVENKNLSKQIEEVQRMYFQFDFDKEKRPKREEQKQFLSRILKAKEIEYQKDDHQLGSYNETIIYDYTFFCYGVKFFNFDLETIGSQTLNKVKAWAWNCQNSTNGKKIIIIYSASDEKRPDVASALDILKTSAYKMISINDGFGSAIRVLDELVSE